MRVLQHSSENLARKIARRLKITSSWPHHFSQEGEDLILARFFEGKKQGFYVDVGAHHPVRFSNTYLFYQRGWRGINIDGMPGSMKEFDKMRPGDQNIEALISSEPREVEFFLFNEPALNTCDPGLVRERDGLAGYRVIEKTVLRTQTLAAILDKTVLPKEGIDFMSVDVEGMDLDVLSSNDWNRFRPTVILAEDFGVSTVEKALVTPVARLLKEKGYSMFAKSVNTLLFENAD